MLKINILYHFFLNKDVFIRGTQKIFTFYKRDHVHPQNNIVIMQ